MSAFLIRAALLGLLVGIVAPGANATVLSDAQWLRSHGCAGHHGSQTPLRERSALDEAARRWAFGAALTEAIDASGYRAERSDALYVEGNQGALRAALVTRLCGALTDGRFREIGIDTRGRKSWLIVAIPFQTPPRPSQAAMTEQVVRLINRARAEPRWCGRQHFAAAPALQVDARLVRAAARHANDMLAHDFFAHAGWDGSTPAQRVSASGYRYRLVGENIAFGMSTPQEAVRGWLHSPEHCENLMDPTFSQTGVALAVNRRGPPRIYWVQDFGAPARAEREPR